MRLCHLLNTRTFPAVGIALALLASPWLAGCKSRSYNDASEADQSSFAGRGEKGSSFLLAATSLVLKSSMRDAADNNKRILLNEEAARHVCFYSVEVSDDDPRLPSGKETSPIQALGTAFAPRGFPRPSNPSPLRKWDVLDALNARRERAAAQAHGTRTKLERDGLDIKKLSADTQAQLELAWTTFAESGLPLDDGSRPMDEFGFHAFDVRESKKRGGNGVARDTNELMPRLEAQLGEMVGFATLGRSVAAVSQALGEGSSQRTSLPVPLTKLDPAEFDVLSHVLLGLESKRVDQAFLCPSPEDALKNEKSRKRDSGQSSGESTR